MIHEVRIFNPKGQFIKGVSKEELIQRYWEEFQNFESSIGLMPSGTQSVPLWIKKKLDIEFPPNDGRDFYNCRQN